MNDSWEIEVFEGFGGKSHLFYLIRICNVTDIAFIISCAYPTGNTLMDPFDSFSVCIIFSHVNHGRYTWCSLVTGSSVIVDEIL